MDKTVYASTSGETVFTVPKVNLAKVFRVEIDNKTSNPVTVELHDKFTPDPSIRQPSPSEVDKLLKKITVPANSHYDTKDIEIDVMGSLVVIASVDSNDVAITIEYDFE